MIPPISIIIPIYNGALLIARCLNSVFNQEGDFDLEVIVIDDGSTDDSLETVKNYNKDIIVLQQTNQGPAAARNKGIEKATGKYLAFLDADDYWKSTFLIETVSFLENNADAIAVSVGQIHMIQGKKDTISPKILESHPSKFKEALVLDNFYAFWAKHNHVCTGSVLIRTDIVKQTGGQRPELRITEDLEYWAYLATYGKWGFIPKILFVSDGGEVTKEQGWLEKNKKRWASAPAVEHWEQRIIKKLHPTQLISFNKAKGKIAKNLTYAMLMSKRVELARQTTLKYKEFYPKDKVAFLLGNSSSNKLFWCILAKVIFLRERLR